jgi:hypothetical protein
VLGNDFAFIFRQHNLVQNHDMERDDKSFENMTKFKHLGTTLTNENCMFEGI